MVGGALHYIHSQGVLHRDATWELGQLCVYDVTKVFADISGP